MDCDLIVLFEHPEWQEPLWTALQRRGVRYAALDLKQAAFDPDDELRKLLRHQPSLWLPDNLLLLQQYFPVDRAQGIVDFSEEGCCTPCAWFQTAHLICVHRRFATRSEAERRIA